MTEECCLRERGHPFLEFIPIEGNTGYEGLGLSCGFRPGPARGPRYFEPDELCRLLHMSCNDPKVKSVSMHIHFVDVTHGAILGEIRGGGDRLDGMQFGLEDAGLWVRTSPGPCVTDDVSDDSDDARAAAAEANGQTQKKTTRKKQKNKKHKADTRKTAKEEEYPT